MEGYIHHFPHPDNVKRRSIQTNGELHSFTPPGREESNDQNQLATTGARLEFVRRTKDMTQEELAKRANVPLTLVSVHEMNSPEMSEQMSKVYAEALGLNSTWLLTGKGDIYATLEEQLEQIIDDLIRAQQQEDTAEEQCLKRSLRSLAQDLADQNDYTIQEARRHIVCLYNEKNSKHLSIPEIDISLNVHNRSSSGDGGSDDRMKSESGPSFESDRKPISSLDAILSSQESSIDRPTWTPAFEETVPEKNPEPEIEPVTRYTIQEEVVSQMVDDPYDLDEPEVVSVNPEPALNLPTDLIRIRMVDTDQSTMQRTLVCFDNDDIADYARASRLKEQFGADPEKVGWVRVVGETMFPTLREGEKIWIAHIDQRIPEDGEIYLILEPGGINLKRIEQEAGAIWVRSDNPYAPSVRVTPDEFREQYKVLGKILTA